MEKLSPEIKMKLMTPKSSYYDEMLKIEENGENSVPPLTKEEEEALGEIMNAFKLD